MDNLLVDTLKLRDCANDVSHLTKELKEEFEMLFNRISSINTKTKEWVGLASEMFVERTMIEKKQYIHFIKILDDYAEYLMQVSNYYDSCVKKLR